MSPQPSIDKYALMREVAARGGRAEDWLWRWTLISDRIFEIENLEAATENALVPHSDDADINVAVLHLRTMLEDANDAWAQFDYCECFCENAEHALIALRRIAREVGAIQ